MIKPNERHGHVLPHPHGLLARCGGPALCRHCRQELIEAGLCPKCRQSDGKHLVGTAPDCSVYGCGRCVIEWKVYDEAWYEDHGLEAPKVA